MSVRGLRPAIAEAVKRGRTNTAFTTIEEQKKARAGLVDERDERLGSLPISRQSVLRLAPRVARSRPKPQGDRRRCVPVPKGRLTRLRRTWRWSAVASRTPSVASRNSMATAELTRKVGCNSGKWKWSEHRDAHDVNQRCRRGGYRQGLDNERLGPSRRQGWLGHRRTQWTQRKWGSCSPDRSALRWFWPVLPPLRFPRKPVSLSPSLARVS
jgi:hypothetical protein